MAKEKLLSAAKNEKEIGPTKNPDEDEIRLNTVTQILYYLQLEKLPEIRNGSQEDPTEPTIYENELQSITQQTKSKLQILRTIATMITNIEKEESQLKNELSNKILREEYEPLTERLVKC